MDYDAQWPARFRRESRGIRNALGDVALAVEHVGSTAVPGLAAKPVIDIILTVADSAAETSYFPWLETAGYRFAVREPHWYEHRMFKDPPGDVNLHVFSAGCPEIARMVDFRDWLRRNADDRDLYAQVKRELAQRKWTAVQDYADAKSPVISKILARLSQSRERG